ncbi:MAG TPA: response regulator [Thermoanaerobaculia bacterium]|nr:response regulator [Thermoanaerobaculia bacterium]HUM29103.1 response regulator [Thermoanaerobaculia bacterium]HXK67480.1 response regulator [Thermoanaerobaculia bacterium]
MNVVVIDDDPKITNLVQVFLEQKGFRVSVEHDGLTGLKTIEKEHPDLVLCDLLLPGLHGMDLCDRVKRNASLKNIPIILMTGVYKKSKYRIDARRSGADDFIEKPIELMGLWNKIQNLTQAPSPSDDRAIESIRQQIEDLRRDYLRHLPEKIHEIDQHWQQVLIEREVGEVFKALHILVHKLTGSSATFGLSDVSETASRMDVMLWSSLSSGNFLRFKDQNKVSAFIEVLKELAQEKKTAAAATVVDSVPEHVEESSERESRLIYLVENDPLIAEDLALQIGYFGYTIRAFTRADKLREALSASLPAALVMNLDYLRDTPEHGIEMDSLLEIWRSRFPFIILSARGDIQSRLSACRLGGDAFFTKPVDVSKLIEKLELLLGHQSPDPLRVLIVDDDQDLSRTYSLILKQAGIETSIVNDPIDILLHLVDFRADLILMDLYMPTCSGMDLASAIRQMEDYVGVPIVFLSSETELEKQLQAMKMGADDFLIKPIEPNHLLSVVNSRGYRSRMLRSFMVRDGLTGLYNHTSIKEQLSKEVLRAKREGGTISFAMIDIDHFKAINDTYGHTTGDNVLKSLSRLLQQRLRKSDIIGRYGGEEFAIILPGTTDSNAYKVLDDIRLGFAHLKHQSYDGTPFSVEFSAGIASFPSCPDERSLNEEADKALYAAKHRGRNRVVLAADL